MIGLHNRSLADIVSALARLGGVKVFAKLLAPNDNSKNQPYLAKGDLSVLSRFPIGDFVESRRGKSPTFKTPFPLHWVGPDGHGLTPLKWSIPYVGPRTILDGWNDGKEAPQARRDRRQAAAG